MELFMPVFIIYYAFKMNKIYFFTTDLKPKKQTNIKTTSIVAVILDKQNALLFDFSVEENYINSLSSLLGQYLKVWGLFEVNSFSRRWRDPNFHGLLLRAQVLLV